MLNPQCLLCLVFFIFDSAWLSNNLVLIWPGIYFMYLWFCLSVNEVGEYLSDQAANQSVSNLIWPLVCHSRCVRSHPALSTYKYEIQYISVYTENTKYSSPARSHPAPRRSLTLLTSGAPALPASNRMRLRWPPILRRIHACVCLPVFVLWSVFVSVVERATLTSGIACLGLTFLLNGTPYGLEVSVQTLFWSKVKLDLANSSCFRSQFIRQQGLVKLFCGTSLQRVVHKLLWSLLWVPRTPPYLIM